MDAIKGMGGTIKSAGKAWKTISSEATKVADAVKGSGIGEKLADVGDALFTDVANPTGHYQKLIPKQLNPAIGLAAAGAYGAYKLGTAPLRIAEGRKFGGGGVHAGEGMSHMIGSNNSPLISDMADGRYQPKRVGYTGNYMNTEADGQLVMALHQLRR